MQSKIITEIKYGNNQGWHFKNHLNANRTYYLFICLVIILVNFAEIMEVWKHLIDLYQHIHISYSCFFVCLFVLSEMYTGQGKNKTVPIIDMLSQQSEKYKRVGINMSWLLRFCSNIYLPHLLPFHWPKQVLMGGSKSHPQKILKPKPLQWDGGIMFLYKSKVNR